MPIVCTIKDRGSKQGKIKKCKSAKKHRTLQKLKSYFTGELSHKLRRHKVLVIPFINKIIINFIHFLMQTLTHKKVNSFELE